MRARVLVMVMVMVCLTDGEIKRCSVATIITVAKLSKASVSCPSFMANSSDIEYHLLFNDRPITQIQLSQKELDSAERLFSGQFEVTVYDSGVYICKRKVYYPPQDTVHCYTTEVIVEESLPTINDTVPEANQTCPVRSSFIPEVAMWAGCGVLLVYSLSITCITIAIWRKLKRHEDDTNVYVNTKRGEHRKQCKVSQEFGETIQKDYSH